MRKQFIVDEAIDDAAFILERIDEKWPSAATNPIVAEKTRITQNTKRAVSSVFVADQRSSATCECGPGAINQFEPPAYQAGGPLMALEAVSRVF